MLTTSTNITKKLRGVGDNKKMLLTFAGVGSISNYKRTNPQFKTATAAYKNLLSEYNSLVDIQIQQNDESTAVFTQTFTITGYFKSKNSPDDVTEALMRSITLNGTRRDIDRLRNEWEEDQLNNFNNTSGVDFTQQDGQTKLVRTNSPELYPQLTPLPTRRVGMREKGAYKLDQYELDDELNTGICVITYLIKQYKYANNMKKHFAGTEQENIDRLLEGFKTVWIDEDDESPETYDPAVDGINTEQIRKFCIARSIPLYAFDKELGLISKYSPIKKSAHKALVYVVANSHIYPIKDDAKRTELFRRSADSTTKFTPSKQHIKQKNSKNVKLYIPEFSNDIALTGNDYAFDIIQMTNTIPSKITCNGSIIDTFCIADTMYISRLKTMTDELIEKWYIKHDIHYMGQQETAVLKELQEMYKFNIDRFKSQFNNHTYNEMLKPNVKNRTHVGALFDLTHLLHESSQDPSKSILQHKVLTGEIMAYDINKAYSHALYNINKFIVYNANDVLLPYVPVDNLQLGLYYVNTNDMTLFHGSNWYSTEMVNLAIEDNIQHTIEMQFIPSENNFTRRCVDGSVMQNFIDQIKLTLPEEGSEKLLKALCNRLAGTFGQTKKVSSKTYIDTNSDIAFNYGLDKIGENGLIQNDINTDPDGKPMYLYGSMTQSKMPEIAVPIYIQITDHANMLLYNLTKKVGGTLLYRKTDMIIVDNGRQLTPVEGWGGFKIERLTNTDNEVTFTPKYNMRPSDERSVLKPYLEKSFTKISEINNSDNPDEIIDLAEKSNGLLIKGCGGTGKSYVILNNTRMTSENTLKLAFTNKAANNISGQTIHRAFAINDDNQVSQKSIQRGKNLNYIVVDEISMVPEFLLIKLMAYKQANPHIIFILMGDYRQLKSINNNLNYPVNNFTHPIVKYLCSGSCIELTQIKRYDVALSQYSLDGYESRNWADLPSKEIDYKNLTNDRVICYLNSTRKDINDNAMIAIKPPNAILIPYNQLSHNSYGADIWLYLDLPVMCVKHNKKYDIVNSDEYTVSAFNDDDKTVELTNITDEEKTVELTYNELMQLFVVNYSITVHKSQGSTFNDTIYLTDIEWLKQDRTVYYTAITRATKMENLYYGIM